MNKLLMLSIWFVFLFPVFGKAQLSGDLWRTVEANGNGKLTVCYYETPAFIQKNEQGEMNGICVEILEHFSQYVREKYGYEVSLQYIAGEKQFSSFLKSMEAAHGGVIGVGNVSVTEERKQRMQFTNPYFENFSVLLTHNSVKKMNSLKDISRQQAGFRALAVKGSIYEPFMKGIRDRYMPDLQIEYVASGREVLSRLSSDPRTFTVTDFIEYYSAIKQQLPVRSHLPAADLPHDQLGFVLPLNSDWKAVFDEFLNENYLQTSEYRRIIQQHLGRAFI